LPDFGVGGGVGLLGTRTGYAAGMVGTKNRGVLATILNLPAVLVNLETSISKNNGEEEVKSKEVRKLSNIFS
jgi:hypothetical protein